jgi:signal transduction histidine kinase
MRLRGHPGAASAHHFDRHYGGLTIDRSGVIAGLAAIVLSTPALMALAFMMGIPHGVGLTIAGIWSLAQIPILVYVMHHRLSAWSKVRTHDVEARVASAEATVRRDEERLHELRSTVAGIGMTYRLLRDRRSALPRTTRSRLEELYESELGRLERLLGDQPAATVGEVDVNAAVGPLVDSLRLRGHRVVQQGTPAVALGRYDDVVEIVHILLENAARHAPDSDIEVHVLTEDRKVWIQVSDHGPGVPESVLPHLFDRGTRGPESPGQGIGLHIARRLALDMGGELRFDARHKEPGATFTVVLPAMAGSDACLVHSR